MNYNNAVFEKAFGTFDKLEASDLLQARSDEQAHASPADQHDASQ